MVTNQPEENQNPQVQQEVLKHITVGHANKLLVDSLNSGCEVTLQVREEIEETLLLPIAEIEKRRMNRK